MVSLLTHRLALGMVALLALAGTLLLSIDNRLGRGEVVAALDGFGLLARQPEARRTVTGEADHPHAKIAAGRLLLADALDLGAYAELESIDARVALMESRVGGLRQAQEFAFHALEGIPSSWEAALVLGGSRYLERSIERDQRLITHFREWEAPLERALELAPSGGEVERFLTMAYLEVWPVLSEDKREQTRTMLHDALLDQATFDRMIGPWLQVNDDMDEALELLPRSVYAHDRVGRLLATAGDWRRFSSNREAWREAHYEEAQSRLEDGLQRVRGGDTMRGRERLVRVLQAPTDVRFAGLVARAVEAIPAGPGHSTALTWLQWQLDRCLFGDCVFDGPATKRLASLATGVDPATEARALVVAGDLSAAEGIERRHETRWQRDWNTYWVAKARAHLERDEPDLAASALAETEREFRRDPVWIEARLSVATRRNETRALETLTEALDKAAGMTFDAVGWTLLPDRLFRHEIRVAREASNLRLEVAASAEGGAVEVFLDGRFLGPWGVSARRKSKRFTMATDEPIEPGMHLVEIRQLAGSTISPGLIEVE